MTREEIMQKQREMLEKQLSKNGEELGYVNEVAVPGCAVIKVDKNELK